MSAEKIIELIGVDVSPSEAPERILMRDVQWRIGRGEFWIVGGEQASGKSSLLMTAAGLNRPAGGTLRIFGRQLSEATEQDQVGWRRRIGYVFENGGRLFSHLTVAQNIALPLQYHLHLDDDETVAKVEEILKLGDLQAYAAATPSRLSLRVQQRVSLLRALTASPEILFLDNPLAGLAVRDSRWWLKYLGQLRAAMRFEDEPLTLVVGCDDFRGWLEAGTHFAVIEKGRFREVGDREKVRATEEPFVREFLTNAI